MKNAASIKKTLSLLLALILLFAFVACGNGGDTPSAGEEISGESEVVFVKPENYATVLTVTINPQFRLYLDADGIVLAVEPVNKDAEEVKEALSFENDNYEAVVEKIVTKSEEKGYIKDNAVINVEISEIKDTAVNTVEILDKITVTVNQTATKLEVTVEIKTEDKSAVMEQPTEDATESATTEPQKTEPTEAMTTVPTQCKHTYKAATCTAPKTCSKCGATEGAAAGHNWKDATCIAPKTCKTCKATEGQAMGHSYKDATCTAPKTCSKCGATEGEMLKHTYQNGVCTCGARQLGIGIWQAYKLDGDVLEIIKVYSEGGIWEYTYLDKESEDTETIQQMIQGGCSSITYKGKTYLKYGGAGDPMYYEDIEDNSITIHIGDPSDNYPDKFTLQRHSANKLVVTSVVGCNWPGITAGMIFTYVG